MYSCESGADANPFCASANSCLMNWSDIHACIRNLLDIHATYLESYYYVTNILISCGWCIAVKVGQMPIHASWIGWTSVWKSSPKTGKKPRPDRTITDQDRKISGPIKTATTVRSSVHLHLANLKTDKNRFGLVATGLWGPKNRRR